MKNMFYENIIIGAGPIGLYLASKINNCLLLEATNKVGGQLINLYPEKEIIDIPNMPSIKAKDYISFLVSNIDKNKIKTNEKVVDVIQGDIIKVITNNAEYHCKNLIICTGLGFSSPRKLGLENEDTCSNIIYHLKDYMFLKNKRVAIFGGGDSALDWAKTLSQISPYVSLIHRRDEFRGNADTIKGIKNLSTYLSYVPKELIKEDKKASKIVIHNLKNDSDIELPVDYILVNFGNIAELTNFNLEQQNGFLKTDNNFTVAKNIYACGDCISYENKKRRIAPGIDEANKILKIIG